MSFPLLKTAPKNRTESLSASLNLISWSLRLGFSKASLLLFLSFFSCHYHYLSLYYTNIDITLYCAFTNGFMHVPFIGPGKACDFGFQLIRDCPSRSKRSKTIPLSTLFLSPLFHVCILEKINYIKSIHSSLLAQHIKRTENVDGKDITPRKKRESEWETRGRGLRQRHLEREKKSFQLWINVFLNSSESIMNHECLLDY